MTAEKRPTDLTRLTVFTTGQAAKIARLSQRTIIHHCNSGKLPCYFVPGSSHRRITRAALAKFLKENGMPDGGLGDEKQ